jgi:hypothetical protein
MSDRARLLAMAEEEYYLTNQPSIHRNLLPMLMGGLLKSFRQL